jgi:hypothetical protein
MPKLVLMALADEADDNGFCFPSHRRLAWKCTTSMRTVRRMVSILASQRYLVIEFRFGKDRSRTSNGYRLAFADPPDKLTRGSSADRDPLANSDQGPWSVVARGMDSSVRVTTTYPLSFPIQQPPAQRASQCEPRPSPDGGGCGGDLCFPEGLTPAQRRGITKQLAHIDRATAQQLIDELAGRMRATTIKSPIRYCAALADRWKRGEFAPELAPAIAGERLAARQPEAAACAPSSAGPASSSVQLSDGTTTRLPTSIRAPLERLRSKFETQSTSERAQRAMQPQNTLDGSNDP